MGTVDKGRVNLFFQAVRRVAARELGPGYRITDDQYILETADDAVILLAPLWAELVGSGDPGCWEEAIARHLHACIQLTERVADLDVERTLDTIGEPASGQASADGVVAEPTLRLRLSRRQPRSIAVDLGAGWELGVVIDLGLGSVPVTADHLARRRAQSPLKPPFTPSELLWSARRATREAAQPHLAAAGMAPGLTLMSAGSHTAGCLLDLDRLISAAGRSPTLVRPVNPSVVIVGQSTGDTANRALMALAQSVAALHEALSPTQAWRDVPLWQFHSNGRLGIFEV